MKISIPAEILDQEKRVAATPETVKKYVQAGLTVTVQAGAGEGSSISDREFEAAGASIEKDPAKLFADADILLKVRRPVKDEKSGRDEVDMMKEGAVLVTQVQPLLYPELVRKLAKRKISTLAIDMVPRIARAQKLDALSSQSNVAGYKSVLMAGNALGKMMPMMMTAAGTISPGRVLVLGAGVAGLQAIATAKRLGAVVEAFDVRPVVKEQVESLGAKFISLEAQAEDQGGYAKELSKDQHKKELELIAQHAKNADIIITTALIPGRPSPKLVTEAMVKSMRPGSVIVDLAIEGGGNCELAEADKEVLRHGVTILAPSNVPGLMASQSSQLYARNVASLIFEIYKDKQWKLNRDDEIIQGALITQGGEIVHRAVVQKMTPAEEAR